MATTEEHAVQVHLVNAAPSFQRATLGILRDHACGQASDARVVHQHLEPAVPLDHETHGLGPVGVLGHVEAAEVTAPSRGHRATACLVDVG